MYRPEDLYESLKTLIGWRKDNSLEDIVPERLSTSESFEYFQSFHPMVTLRNARSVFPSDQKERPLWDGATQYDVGEVVQHNSKLFVGLEVSQNQDPEVSPQSWEETSEFALWLETFTKDCILKAMRNVWTEKIASETARNNVELKPITNSTGRILDELDNTQSLVGFEVTPFRANGALVKLGKVGFMFNEACSFDLYVYHSSSLAPIAVQRIDYTAPKTFKWFDLNVNMVYERNDLGPGGSYYIAYDQAELGTAKAIIKRKDWSKGPCSGCDRTERIFHKYWSQYVEFHPFKVNNASISELWDIADNAYTYESNYGMNFKIAVECDPTDIFIDIKQSLVSVIGLTLASELLRRMAYNPEARINRNQANSASKMEILYELDGDSQSFKKSGLNYELNTAVKALSVDLTSLSRVCFSCAKKGVRFRTV